MERPGVKQGRSHSLDKGHGQFIVGAEGPRPQKGLVKKIFLIWIGDPLAVDLGSSFFYSFCASESRAFPSIRSGISERTLILARTSSLRLVSWVEVVIRLIGPEFGSLDILTVKDLRESAEFLRIPADFIKRNQPVVDIKNRILHALGHNRAGDLLESHRQSPASPFFPFRSKSSGYWSRRIFSKKSKIVALKAGFFRMAVATACSI